MKRRKQRRNEAPRTLFLSLKLRPGTTETEAEEMAGFFAAAVDDAAGVYRSRNGTSPFEGQSSAVVAADIQVTTLH